MRKETIQLPAQADILSEGHEQSQAAGARDLGASKRADLEISDVLTYLQDTFLEVHPPG
jgi:hypothetical protein